MTSTQVSHAAQAPASAPHTDPTAATSTHPLPFGRKLAYGLGDFGSNYCWTFVASFVMFYMTNVVGLGAAMLGTLMLVARALDGITDVIVGGLIDKTHTRMGKARPWLFWSTFPLAISQIMLFNVPASLPEGGRYAWFFVCYVLLGAFFYTASNISYNALVSLATDHQPSRVSMGSIRFMCAVIAGVVLTSTTPALLKALGNEQRAWTIVAVMYSLVFVVFTLITVFGVKEMATTSEASSPSAAQEGHVSFLQSLGYLVRNRYFFLMLALFIVGYLASGAGQTAGIYFATYVLGDANLMAPLSMVGMLPMVIALLIVPMLAKKWGMRNLCLYATVLGAIGTAIAYFGMHSFPLLLLGLALSASGSAPFIGTMYAFVAATAEYSFLKFGVKMEGVVYSCCSVGIKVGTGLGTAVVGWMLAAGSFDAHVAIQPDSALTAITSAYLLLPLILTLIKLPLTWFLDVEATNERLRSTASAQ